MRESEVVVIAERVRGAELPECVHQMNQRIGNPRDFEPRWQQVKDYTGCTNITRQGLNPCPSQNSAPTLMSEKPRSTSY